MPITPLSAAVVKSRLKATAIVGANTVAMIATSKPGTKGQVVNIKQYEREKDYWVAMLIFRNMLRNGLIDVTEYRAIATNLRAEYQPIIEGLLDENA